MRRTDGSAYSTNGVRINGNGTYSTSRAYYSAFGTEWIGTWGTATITITFCFLGVWDQVGHV